MSDVNSNHNDQQPYGQQPYDQQPGGQQPYDQRSLDRQSYGYGQQPSVTPQYQPAASPEPGFGADHTGAATGAGQPARESSGTERGGYAGVGCGPAAYARQAEYQYGRQSQQQYGYGASGAAPQYAATGQPVGWGGGQPYPPQGAYYPQPANASWNVMSIVGFILAFVIAPAGLVLSIVALVQINKSHERSRGLSIAGIVVGALNTILVIAAIALAIWAVGFVLD